MTDLQWKYFSDFRKEFYQMVEIWSEYGNELAALQKQASKNDTPEYLVETPVEYNTSLDLITEKDDIKLIVIGDNPGKNEQLKKNQRYLVGQAGKLGENFFKNNPELGIDFRKNVIILNKTPVHTAKTNHLKYLEKNSVRAKMLIEESQKWMAKKTAELHHNLLSADLENSVELWLVGYGELKAKGIFSAYKKELKENYKEKKDWEKVFVFRHFSMNSFSNEFNKIHKEKADLKVKEILEKLGTMHKNDIFGTD